MLSRLLSKLFVVALLVTTSAQAEIQGQASGFLFGTYFSQHDWYADRQQIAINGDITSDWVNFRTQVNSRDGGTLRRATIEKDFSIGKKGEVTLKYGRFARVNSFFDSVTDTPAAAGMALLPQSGYNYRMYDGSFVLMDGYQIVPKVHFGDNLVYAVVSRGQMVITDQKSLAMEVFKQPIKDINLIPVKDQYDASLHWENGGFHTYYGYSEFGIETEIITSNALSRASTAKYHRMTYITNKVGARYVTNKWFVQGEYIHGDSYAYTNKEVKSTVGEAEDKHLYAGYMIVDNWTPYVGISHGANIAKSTVSEVRAVGVTYAKDKLTVSVERNVGNTEGGWRDYTSTVKEINSYIASVTYQF